MIEYKIGEIFSEIKNKIHSGTNLREIIDHIDELRFRSQTEKHELSHLYDEAKIKNMGNAGRNGGEYYTPRPLIRAIVKVVRPELGKLNRQQIAAMVGVVPINRGSGTLRGKRSIFGGRADLHRGLYMATTVAMPCVTIP